MEIPPTHYPASRAASVAESCINYQQGTPHKLFLVQTVKQASLEVSQLAGCRGTRQRSLHSQGSQLGGLPTPLHPTSGFVSLFVSRDWSILQSLGAVLLFSQEGRDSDTVFLWALLQRSGGMFSMKGGILAFPQRENYRNYFQKNLKTASSFLIYSSNLDQQKLWSCK